MLKIPGKVAVITLSAATLSCAASPDSINVSSPKYKADVPVSITTPDSVQTKYLGELKFVDGFPTDETVAKIYDFLDTSRAVELFLDATPVASMYAMLNGHKEIGFKANRTVGITETLMNARSLWLTPQTTTPYVHVEVDVKNGPVVFEIGSPVLGLLDDAFFRYVADIGVIGADKGKGGKYLVVGPDYKGDIPEGYFVLKTKTYRHWLLMRIAVVDGKTQQAVDAFKKTFRIYPLALAKNPPTTEFVNLSDKQYNTIHANDSSFYNELNEVIQYEPADAYDPEIVGLAASIGIKKGRPFNPDVRMQKILTEAAAIANASARAILFRPRNKAVYFYPDRQWYSPLAGGSYEFLNNGERILDDRVAFYYYATGSTPTMVKPMVGKGSVYEIAATDKNGDPLDGSKTYSVTLPAPIPVNNFWSLMVYDNQTRSILETDQKTGGVDSNLEGMIVAKDGSVTVYFGPKAPVGQENNWVQTMPGRGYNVLLRLYGPLQPWFDKTWKPGDFELVN
jgi:hypothetical protein